VNSVVELDHPMIHPVVLDAQNAVAA